MSLPRKTGDGVTPAATPAAIQAAFGAPPPGAAAVAAAPAAAARPSSSSRSRSAQVTTGGSAERAASLSRHPSSSSSSRHVSSSAAARGQHSSRHGSAAGGAAAAASASSSSAAASSSAAPAARSARRPIPSARPVVSLLLNAFTGRKFLLDYVSSRDHGALHELLCTLGAQIVLQQDGPDVTLVYDGAKQMTAAVHNGANNRFLNAAQSANSKKGSGSNSGLMESRLDRARRMAWPHLRYEEALAKANDEKKKCEDCTVRIIVTANSKLFEPEITEYPLVRQITVQRNRQTGQAAAAPVLGPLVNTIPRLDWDAPRGACPFLSGNQRLDEVGRQQQEEKEKRRAAHLQAKFEAQQQKAAMEAGGAAGAAAAAPSAAAASAVPAVPKPQGRPQYCEFCDVYIEDEQTHFNTPQHQELFDRPERREFARLQLLDMEANARFLRAAELKAPKYRAIALAKAEARAKAAAAAAQPKTTSPPVAAAAPASTEDASPAEAATAAPASSAVSSLSFDAMMSAASAAPSPATPVAAAAQAAPAPRKPAPPPVPLFDESSSMDCSAPETLPAPAASSSSPQLRPRPVAPTSPSSTPCPMELDEADATTLDAISAVIASSSATSVAEVTPASAPLVAEPTSKSPPLLAAAASMPDVPPPFDDERKEPPPVAAVVAPSPDPELESESKEAAAEQDSPATLVPNSKSPPNAHSLKAALSPLQMSLAPIELPINLAAASTPDLLRHAAGLCEAPESMKQKLDFAPADAAAREDESKDPAARDSITQQPESEQPQPETVVKSKSVRRCRSKTTSAKKKQAPENADAQAVTDAADDTDATSAAALPSRSEAALPTVAPATAAPPADALPAVALSAAAAGSPVVVAPRSSNRKRSAPTRLAEEPDEPTDEAPKRQDAAAPASAAVVPDAPVAAPVAAVVSVREKVKPKRASKSVQAEQPPSSAEPDSATATAAAESSVPVPTASSPTLTPAERRAQKITLDLLYWSAGVGGLPAEGSRRSRQAKHDASASANATADPPPAKRAIFKKAKQTKPSNAPQEAEDSADEITITRHVKSAPQPSLRRSMITAPDVAAAAAPAPTPVAATEVTAEATTPSPAAAAAPTPVAVTDATTEDATCSAAAAAADMPSDQTAVAVAAATPPASSSASAKKKAAAALKRAAAAEAKRAAKAAEEEATAIAAATAVAAATAAAAVVAAAAAEENQRKKEEIARRALAAAEQRAEAVAAAMKRKQEEKLAEAEEKRLTAVAAQQTEADAAAATAAAAAAAAEATAAQQAAQAAADTVAQQLAAEAAIAKVASPKRVRIAKSTSPAIAAAASVVSPSVAPLPSAALPSELRALLTFTNVDAPTAGSKSPWAPPVTEKRSADARARAAQAASVPKKRAPAGRAVAPAPSSAPAAPARVPAAAAASPAPSAAATPPVTRSSASPAVVAATLAAAAAPVPFLPSSPPRRSGRDSTTRQLLFPSPGGAGNPLLVGDDLSPHTSPRRTSMRQPHISAPREFIAGAAAAASKSAAAVKSATAGSPQKRKRSSADASSEDLHEVESIVAHRGSGSHLEYRVKWVGWDAEKDITWEPASTFKGLEVVADYHNRIQTEEQASNKGDETKAVARKAAAKSAVAEPPSKRARSSTTRPAASSSSAAAATVLSPASACFFGDLLHARASPQRLPPMYQLSSAMVSSPRPPGSKSLLAPNNSLTALARGGAASSALPVSPSKARSTPLSALEKLTSPEPIAAKGAAAASALSPALSALVSPPIKQRLSAPLLPHSASSAEEMSTPPTWARNQLRPQRRGAEIDSLQHDTPTLLSGPAKRGEWSSAKRPSAPPAASLSFTETPTPAAAAAAAAASSSVSAASLRRHSRPLVAPVPFNLPDASDVSALSAAPSKGVYSKRKDLPSAPDAVPSAAASSLLVPDDPFAFPDSPARLDPPKKQKVHHAAAASAPFPSSAARPVVPPAEDVFAFDIATPERPNKDKAPKNLLLHADKNKAQ